MFSYRSVPDDTFNAELKEDAETGLVEFPSPGEFKKCNHLLFDPEEEVAPEPTEESSKGQDLNTKDYWMPDKLCKVCYACLESFTMYRRRHHCRMCGQVFCNTCSSHYIDSTTNGTTAPVRSCRLCYEQLGGRFDSKLVPRRKRISLQADLLSQSQVHMRHKSVLDAEGTHTGNRPSITSMGVGSVVHPHIVPLDISPALSNKPPRVESGGSADNACTNANKASGHGHAKGEAESSLQNRASTHLDAVVEMLVRRCIEIPTLEKALWRALIVQLVREVVSNVDPDVRAGDSMDIRPYVKLKVIPGGRPDESTYVAGVVFRKNIVHRCMIESKDRPRILLLGGGIDFERLDHPRLSSLDTLLEQEDRYLEILVEKIMSLKPNLILVGKSVARRAQELLSAHNVAVIQNIKPKLLDRISRMTGARMLPATDHMIQQYGEQCLGTCERFWLRHVNDNPERVEHIIKDRRKTVRAPMYPGSTYVYLDGCPSELGCSIILRGADRQQLRAIKTVISFSVMLAYHLRLEVAYYTDRFANLPETMGVSDPDGSDDEYEFSRPSGPCEADSASDAYPPELFSRAQRLLLSSSLDVDVGLPHRDELRGLTFKTKVPLARFTPLEHQTLLVTSLLLVDSNSVGASAGAASSSSARIQRARAEVKGIRFYTAHDLTLGQFLIDSCFYVGGRRDTLLDHTLSFVHRPGRLDITLTEDSLSSGRSTFDNKLTSLQQSSRIPGLGGMPVVSSTSVQSPAVDFSTNNQSQSQVIPITMASYCKICMKIVTPEVALSEESWKMSFGKFMEISFYCRSATSCCGHNIRDDSVLKFFCEGYCTNIVFVPVRSSSLHIRTSMPFPEDFHAENNIAFMRELSEICNDLIDKFSHVVSELEREAYETFASTAPESLAAVSNQLTSLRAEMLQTSTGLAEDVAKVGECLKEKEPKPTHAQFDQQLLQVTNLSQVLKNDNNGDYSFMLALPEPIVLTQDDDDLRSVKTESSDVMAEDVALRFPLAYKRELYLRACSWNELLQTVYRRIEEHQGQGLGLAAVAVAVAADAYSAVMSVGREDTHSQWSSTPLVEPLSASAVSSTSTFSDPNTPATINSTDDTVFGSQSGAAWQSVDSQESSPSPQTQDSSPLVASTSVQSLPLSTRSVPVLDALLTDGLQVAANVIETSDGSSSHIDPPGQTSNVHAIPDPQQQHDSSSTLPGAITHPLAAVVAATPKHVPSDDSTSRYQKYALELPDKKKGNRLQKALARLLGKDSAGLRFIVPLGTLGTGRLGLKPGRNGRVLPVFDDELASIIAYSLSSEEYRLKVREVSEEPKEVEEMDDEEGSVVAEEPEAEADADVDGREMIVNSLISDSDGAEKVVEAQLNPLKEGIEKDDIDSSMTTHFTNAEIGDPMKQRISLEDLHGGTGSDTKIRNPELTFFQSGMFLEGEESESRQDDGFTELSVLSIRSGTDAEELDSETKEGDIPTEQTSNEIVVESQHYECVGDSEGEKMDPVSPVVEEDTGNMRLDAVTAIPAATAAVVPIAVSVPLSVPRQRVLDPIFDDPEVRERTHPLSHAAPIPSPVPLPLQGVKAADQLPAVGKLPEGTLPPTGPLPGPSSGNGFVKVSTGAPNVTVSSVAGGSAGSHYCPNERQMLSQSKTHVKHRFVDTDEKGNVLCKFVCQTFYSTQFQAVRASFLGDDGDEGFVRSLSAASRWNAQGGKSGAKFSRSQDGRLVIKQISRTELQMFLDFAPAYFEYMAKAYYHKLPSLLCKILGVYQIGYHNKVNGKKVMEQVVVMENLFYERNISIVFDLKGSSRRSTLPASYHLLDFDEALLRRRLANRRKREIESFSSMVSELSEKETTEQQTMDDDSVLAATTAAVTKESGNTGSESKRGSTEGTKKTDKSPMVLLDDNLMALTLGLPFPLRHRAKVFFQKAVLNDTLFLSIINVVDYSIIVGFDDVNHEVVVGIIDYMRQYDMIKRVESMGKSVGMMVGKEEPTVIPPQHYRKRFQTAMEKYFMTVPDKWVAHEV